MASKLFALILLSSLVLSISARTELENNVPQNFSERNLSLKDQ
jgi:hypothetical protein